MSENTPFQDPFEFLKRMWEPMGIPMGGAATPAMVAPLLDANEIDKRIADLKAVENWLSMNLSMLRISIQGLEMQKSTLSAFQVIQSSAGTTQQSLAESASAATAAATSVAASAADAWWSLLQQAQSGVTKTDERKDQE